MEPGGYMDEKNFDEWNSLKKKLNSESSITNFREGDVWFCSIGNNVGHEQNGKNTFFERPVLIVRKFTKNYFWAIPLTSADRTGPYSFKFEFNGKERVGLLFHLRFYDRRRLQRKLGSVSQETLRKIKQMSGFLLNQKTLFPGSKDGTTSVTAEVSEAC